MRPTPRHFALFTWALACVLALSCTPRPINITVPPCSQSAADKAYGAFAPIHSGYQVFQNIDFSAQSSQTLSSNTTYTIAGLTWTKVNSSGDGTAMAVTNGSGLVIIPASASDWNGSTFTAPALTIPLQSLYADLACGMGVRISIYISSYNGAANYDNVIIGVDSGTVAWSQISKRGNGTGNVGIQSQATTNSTGRGFLSGTALTIGSTNDIFILEIPALCAGLYFPSFAAHTTGQTYSPWPLQKDIVRGGNGSYDYWPQTNNGWGDTMTAANARLVLSAQRAASGTALSATIKNLRFEARL